MGVYSDYINRRLTFDQISIERKNQLKRISALRGRDVLVYASDFNKGAAPISIIPADFLPFRDQLSNVKTKDIDIIIETTGGIAETVEDMVELVRSRYERVGIIIAGMAKSAGTIFSMAGDEILMSATSSLGPIDAQIVSNGKKFSADAFIDGLDKIKSEVLKVGRLNPAYIPMLQSISPGETKNTKPQFAHANFICPKCTTQFQIQLNFEKNVNIKPGSIVYPKNDIFVCPKCSTQTNLSPMRLQLEAQTGLKINL